jgi:tetratricopeptide (TPR) repeat protein
LSRDPLADAVYGGPEAGQAREHVHDANCHHDHDEDHQGAPPAGGEQEILPWLRLSAELDPERVQTYVLASYWLRTKLGKITEAEQFLREGLHANPGDCEILLELGRVYYESRKDMIRARNVLELAWKNWRQREAGKTEPDLFLGAQILNLLALLEREQNNPARALEHYRALLEITPHQEVIQRWIDLLQTNAPAAPTAAPR